MNILFWTPPWASQGKPLFFKNSCVKTLLPQAELLSQNGFTVDFFWPSFYGSPPNTEEKINFICSNQEINSAHRHQSNDGDIFENLYKGNLELNNFIQSKLEKILKSKYDVIILWENPVPYLENLFDDALIISQMPGFFSRTPYNDTITFDILGLYKDSSFTKFATDIKSNSNYKSNFSDKIQNSLTKLYNQNSQNLINEIKEDISHYSGFSLLPLQISQHYSFKHDTKYSNQFELLMDSLNNSNKNETLIVTQYVSNHASEIIMDDELVENLKKQFPNLYFNTKFNSIDNISQRLLAHCNTVMSASSSLGMQTYAYNTKFKAMGENSFLKPYETFDIINESVIETQKTNTLNFISQKYQPLSNEIKYNSKFLISLIEEYKIKKGMISKADDFINFSDIDSEYEDKYFNNFPRKEFILTNLKESSQNKLKVFRKNCEDKAIKTITFDVFDTLVCRPTERPVDVFKLMEIDALNVTNNKISNFEKCRRDAEFTLKQQMPEDKFEISLLEIHNKIRETYNLTLEESQNLMNLEFNTELDLIQERPFGKNLFEIAKSTNKPIYLISDMYLSQEQIERLLKKCNFEGYQELIVSADIGLKKHDGQLFEYFMNNYNFKSSEIYHVGDNKVGDFSAPVKKGIKCFYFPSASDHLRMNKEYNELFPKVQKQNSKSRSTILGLVTNKIFDDAINGDLNNSLFENNPEIFGYSAIGPILLGYTKWLYETTKQDGITDIFFLSREGYILKKAYDKLYENVDDKPKSHYLLSSRRCLRTSNIKSRTDIAKILMEDYRKNTLLYDIFESRLGIKLSESDIELCQEYGFKGIKEPLNSDLDTRDRLIKVAFKKEHDIYRESQKKLDAYQDYLSDMKFLDSKKPAIADVGWNANMQNMLGDITGKRLSGYYYATTEDASTWKEKGDIHKSYSTNYFCMNHSHDIIHKEFDIFEYIICHTDPTLLHFTKEGSSTKPIFHQEKNLIHRKELISKIHYGALNFIMEYKSTFSRYMDNINLSSDIVTRIYEEFATNPKITDHMIFNGHNHENMFRGSHSDSINAKFNKTLNGQKIVNSANNKILDKKVHKEPLKKDLSVSKQNEDTPKRNVFISIESSILKKILPPKKYQKYKMDRKKFFKDSESNLSKIYQKLS